MKDEMVPVEIDLTQTTDAQVWTKQFLRVLDLPMEVEADEGTVLSYFANALETGRRIGQEEAEAAAFMAAPINDSFVLDEDSEFECAVRDLVEMFRKKNANYARDGMDIFQGFIDIADDMQSTPLDAAAFGQAKHRLNQRRYLKDRKFTPGADDAFTDGPVYAIIMKCLFQRELM